MLVRGDRLQPARDGPSLRRRHLQLDAERLRRRARLHRDARRTDERRRQRPRRTRHVS